MDAASNAVTYSRNGPVGRLPPCAPRSLSTQEPTPTLAPRPVRTSTTLESLGFFCRNLGVDNLLGCPTEQFTPIINALDRRRPLRAKASCKEATKEGAEVAKHVFGSVFHGAKQAAPDRTDSERHQWQCAGTQGTQREAPNHPIGTISTVRGYHISPKRLQCPCRTKQLRQDISATRHPRLLLTNARPRNMGSASRTRPLSQAIFEQRTRRGPNSRSSRTVE